MEPYNVSWKIDKLDFYLGGSMTDHLLLELDWLDSQLFGLEQETLRVCFRNTS